MQDRSQIYSEEEYRYELENRHEESAVDSERGL